MSAAKLRADQVDALSRHWLVRTSAEAGVALCFEALLPRLANVGAAPIVVELVEKAIADERRHASLCFERAQSFASHALVVPPPRDPLLPSFGTNDETLECALLVLGMCCISESIACEWLRACWNAATDPAARALFHAQMKDDIDHARIGWAHFASTAVGPAMKQHLRERWVERMLASNLIGWQKPDEHLPLEGIPELGHLSQVDSLAAIDTAVREVIRPGFAHVGLA